MPNELSNNVPERGALVYPEVGSLLAEPGNGEIDAGPNLAERLQTLRRHAGKISLFVAFCMLVTAVYLLRQHKLYDATAVIRVDPAATQQPVGQNNPSPAEVNDDSLMATEQSEIKSDDVVIPVINDLNLGHDPALNYNPPKPGAKPFLVAGIPHNLLTAVMNSLSVSRPPNTMLLNVSFRARSPELAAQVANAVANSMIQHDYVTRSQSLRASSNYLTAQVQQLRAQMEQSQQQLTAYEQANDILSPDDKFNLLNQRLSTVATDLDKQNADERKLQAEFDLAQSGDVDDLAGTDRGVALQPLLNALHTEQLQFATIAAKYGTADPTYLEAKRRLANYQRAVDAATQHLVAQIQGEQSAKLAQVQMAQAAFAAQKQALEAYNARAAQYSLLKQQADSQTKLYDDMLQRIQQADVAAGYHSNDLRVVETALPNPRPAYPRVATGLLIAFILSLLFAIAAAFVLSGLDHTLSDPTVVLNSTGRPLIGSLPLEDKTELLQLLWHGEEGLLPTGRGYAGRSSYSEAVHSLRASIFLGARRELSSIAVTSAQPREGKTTTTVSLAAACARNGQNTLLVDADLRRPGVHRALVLNNRVGLSTVLQGRERAERLIQKTAIPGFSVLTAGPGVSDSAQLLATSFAGALENLKSQYDLVLVDCPPCLGFADAMVVAPNVDTVLIVARAGDTPREYVRAVVEQIERVRADIAGIVLNGVSANVNQYYRYYRHYSSYYREADAEEQAHAQTAG